MCPTRHSPRKIAPYVSEMLDSAFERWMNTPANPAVTSSDAGISAISSRLRALTRPGPGGRSLRDPPELEIPDQVHRARLGAQLNVEEVGAAVCRDLRGPHTGDEEGLVHTDTGT